MKVTGIVLRGSGMTVTFDDGKIAEVEYQLVNGVLILIGLSNAQKAALAEVRMESSIKLDPRFTGIGASSHIGDGNDTDREKAHYVTTVTSTTAFATSFVFIKILGNTDGLENENKNFELTNNRATYVGNEVNKLFKVQASIMSECSTENIGLGFRIAKNGVTIEQSEGFGLSHYYNEAPAKVDVFIQDIVSLSPGDYIEIWTDNQTSNSDSIDAKLNVIINEF